MSVTIYGIKNCDTMKKARAWLDGRGVEFRFADYRVEGVDPKRLAAWRDTLGWEALLNRASTTWRQLPDADKAGIDEDKATALMLANPTLIKRPVLDVDGRFTVGFAPDLYDKAVVGVPRS